MAWRWPHSEALTHGIGWPFQPDHWTGVIAERQADRCSQGLAKNSPSKLQSKLWAPVRNDVSGTFVEPENLVYQYAGCLQREVGSFGKAMT